MVQTERGPRRTKLVEVRGALWRRIGARVVRELAQGMGEQERAGRKTPTLKTGVNRLGPLLGRELALLLWALQEEGAEAELEAILQGWRELAREVRWWLFTKASAPGQRTGIGWRRALYHALAEAPDSRAAAVPRTEKKPGIGALPPVAHPQAPSCLAERAGDSPEDRQPRQCSLFDD